MPQQIPRDSAGPCSPPNTLQLLFPASRCVYPRIWGLQDTYSQETILALRHCFHDQGLEFGHNGQSLPIWIWCLLLFRL